MELNLSKKILIYLNLQSIIIKKICREDFLKLLQLVFLFGKFGAFVYFYF